MLCYALCHDGIIKSFLSHTGCGDSLMSVEVDSFNDVCLGVESYSRSCNCSVLLPVSFTSYFMKDAHFNISIFMFNCYSIFCIRQDNFQLEFEDRNCPVLSKTQSLMENGKFLSINADTKIMRIK